MPKIVDRYFVVNTYRGKNGWRQIAQETSDVETAANYVERANDVLFDLSGEQDDERFDVFIGSKTALDKIIKGRT